MIFYTYQRRKIYLYVTPCMLDQSQALLSIISERYFDIYLILENTKTKRHFFLWVFLQSGRHLKKKNNLNIFEVLTIKKCTQRNKCMVNVF